MMHLSKLEKTVIAVFVLFGCLIVVGTAAAIAIIRLNQSETVPEQAITLPTSASSPSPASTQTPLPTPSPTLNLTPSSTPTPRNTPTRRPTPTRTPTRNYDEETGGWSTVDIRDLAKNPSKYEHAQLWYTGEIFDIRETDNETIAQVWVKVPGKQYDSEPVYIIWSGSLPQYKGDVITFYGYGLGAVEGLNSFGGYVTQPAIDVNYCCCRRR